MAKLGKKLKKGFKKTGKYIKKHSNPKNINAASYKKTGRIAEEVGGVIEAVGLMSGQPEIVALGAGVQTVGAVASGDLPRAVKHGIRGINWSKKDKVSTGKRVEGAGKAIKGSADLYKTIKEQNKKENEELQNILDQQEQLTGLEKQQTLDLNHITQTLDAMRADMSAQQKIDIKDNPKLSNDIRFLDKEEQVLLNTVNEGFSGLSQGLEIISGELTDISNTTSNVLNELDNEVELEQEQMRDYNEIDDFLRQMDILETFNDIVSFLLRKQEKFNKLNSKDKAKLIRVINRRF